MKIRVGDRTQKAHPKASTVQALDLEGMHLTTQGTIKGSRMPVQGINPSTTGCFMDLDESTPYNTLGTKRSRGRTPHTKHYLSELLKDPNRLPELISIVGATKCGKPKRFFPCVFSSVSLSCIVDRKPSCPVDDCQAWFRRSEHSKRHIRSLHTDERRKSSTGHRGIYAMFKLNR